MDFNALVKVHLFPVLQKIGFEMAEESKNILRFQSSVMKVNIAFNQYDRSFLVEIGKKNDMLYPLNDYAIKKVFDSSLSVEQVTQEVFVQNISSLFETNEGVTILQGDITPLKNVILQQSEDYASELLLKQTLEISEKAWKTKDYAAFVKILDKVGITRVPRSYQLKYKIAKQRL